MDARWWPSVNERKLRNEFLDHKAAWRERHGFGSHHRIIQGAAAKHHPAYGLSLLALDDLAMVGSHWDCLMALAQSLERRKQPGASARVAGGLFGRSNYERASATGKVTTGENDDAARGGGRPNLDVGLAHPSDRGTN